MAEVVAITGPAGTAPRPHAAHFESHQEQREASTLGMWVFLVTEIMFFSGLFTVYLVYRLARPEVFALASRELDLRLGAINTAILISSSFTMALAVKASQLARPRRLTALLAATALLGVAFLVLKSVEYADKFEHHLVPGPAFAFAPAEDGAASGATGADLERGAEMFFSIYFVMTGLHALHMVIGVGVLLGLLWPSWRGDFDAEYHNPIECTGLYWHFVDLVWIYLFPLLYLLGRSQG